MKIKREAVVKAVKRKRLSVDLGARKHQAVREMFQLAAELTKRTDASITIEALEQWLPRLIEVNSPPTDGERLKLGREVRSKK